MDEQIIQNYTPEEIQKILTERDEYLAGWQRAKADLINYQKEVAREREYLLTVMKANVIRKFLPVVDTLEQTLRTIDHLDDNLKKGVAGTVKQFLDALVELGVKKIIAMGEKYNPEFHEVVLTEESKESEDTVIKEVLSGYLLDGKVLRAAQVIVSKK